MFTKQNPKLFIILIMFGLQSCFGIATISKEEKVTKYPDFVILDERGKYTKSSIKKDLITTPDKNNFSYQMFPTKLNSGFESIQKSAWKYKEDPENLAGVEKLMSKITVEKDKSSNRTKQIIAGPFYSRNDILDLWGKPDSQYIKDGVEYWEYKNDINFSGLFIGIIIPIPLMVPVGYHYTVLSFNEHNLDSISFEISDITHGIFCAWSICVDKDTVLIPDVI